MFHMDVAKLDWDVAYIANVSKAMLQVVVQSVSSVLDVCCKRFDRCCICFTHVASV
jgi:hypothetical protein